MLSVKYIDRGFRDSIALIPGWAADYRIFDSLDLKFNYLVPVDFSPFNFRESLLQAMKKNRIEKISLFGWSLGGFVAAEFALKHVDFIDELILVSIRKRYDAGKLLEIRKLLKKNKKGYLYKFYTQCFCDKKDMHWFKKRLLRNYCKKFGLNHLLRSLDYLEHTEIEPQALKDIKKIKIIHGECDSIAPVQEAIDIGNSLTQAKFIRIKNAGHIPFLKEHFAKYI